MNNIFAILFSETKRIRTDGYPLSQVIAYSLLSRAGTSGRYPDDEEFREAFETRNFYNVQAPARCYTFQCLENADSEDGTDIAQKLQDGALSIEHVMPQTLSK